jgi:NAD(P)-dependent dehydrogenase (short-subunit alcohol dehydrogenase family)
VKPHESSPLDLTGKAVVVTGGNSGIGLAIARALANHGADVCVWGRNVERNASAERELAAIGRHALAIRCDVADEGQVEGAFSSAIEAFGKVDACFAAAGAFPPPTRLVDTTVEQWRETLATDLDGTFLTLRAAARHMTARRSGSICLVSSIAALDGAPRRVAYGAAKAGLISLARSAAVELGPNGIRVNAILPGWTDTPLLDGLIRGTDFFSTRWRENVLARIPIRRWARPDEIAGIAVYLASDASAYHTGDCLVIDGGYSAS